MSQSYDQILRRAEEIVKSGDRVRERIGHLYGEASASIHEQVGGLRELTRAVFEGAMGGIHSSEAADPSSVLGKVVEGVGDGLSSSANAVRWTLEEAEKRGEAFAEQDLKKIAGDLEALTEMFEEVVRDAAERIGAGLSEQAGSAKQHAARAMSSVRPQLEAAVSAVLRAPGELGKGLFSAGAKASRHAAGALFAEVGKRLGRLGESLRKDRGRGGGPEPGSRETVD